MTFTGTGIHCVSLKKNGSAKSMHPIMGFSIGSMGMRLYFEILARISERDRTPLPSPKVSHASEIGKWIATPNPAQIGTKLLLTFQVPGGNVGPEAIVRNVAPGEGMGVEFTRMEYKEERLLENLMNRLLQ